jgi:hypothetical protein
MQLRKAQRHQAKMRLGLFGPSGSGKTYTALLIASGMVPWEKICLIDTENGSGDLYDNLGPYNVLTLEAPFHPEKYIKAINTCQAAGIELIIIDSITHEWSGKGGCLELHDEFTRRMKIPNSFTAWNEITPLHQSFIDTILQSSCHIIATGRTKTEYVLTEKNGRQVPQKVGMKIESRDGFEYELTVALDLSISHEAFASKDRTGLFKDGPFVPSAATGLLINAWCNSGGTVVAPEQKPTDDIILAINNGMANAAAHAPQQEQAAPSAPAPAPTAPPLSPEDDPTHPSFEKPTGQQIAIINSLMLNPVFTDDEREKFKAKAVVSSRKKCQDLTTRISSEIVKRQQMQGNAAA